MKFKQVSVPISSLLMLTGIFYGLMTGVAMLLIYFLGIEWKPWFQIQPVSALIGLFIGGLVAYLVVKLESLIGFSSTRLGSDFVRFIRLIGKQPVHVLLLVSMTAGVAEELLFRGVLQSLAVEHLGVTIGIVSVAILFGALHAVSSAYFIYATVFGLVLGIAYHLTRDLLALMLLHAMFDFAAMYMGVYVYGLDSEGKPF